MCLRHFVLEVTNLHGTAKVLGSNLAGPVFFSNGKDSVSQKQCRLIVLSAYVLSV